MNEPYDFGLIGLGVMGRNFILNVADKGFSALGHDLDSEKVSALKEEGGNPEKVDATTEIKDFVAGLSKPRKIMLLVPAGKAVDAVISSIRPYLENGDLLIDGGNSFFSDTDRRTTELADKGIHFFGAGVSGGAKGARLGPSIMPGGSKEAYEHIRPVFEAVAAKYEGEPCVAYLGPKSAGNYVKMVHNGIEYGLMQLTSEVYDFLKRVGNLDNLALQKVFSDWNKGRLQSYLVEITANILGTRDKLGDGFLVDQILDKAKQKGTGKWTSQNAMDLGIPVPTIDIAVSMRQISALKELRQTADGNYDHPGLESEDPAALIRLAEAALYFSFIIAYSQGLHQLREASEEYGYELQLSTIAKIWRAGCIIRAGLLQDISHAFSKNADLEHLLLAPDMIPLIREAVPSVRTLLKKAIDNGVPMPGLSSALVYFDAFTSGRLSLNLIQAQRDYFGAHTYERVDREGTFHTEWYKD
ncbi:NADP-dependent phosphogluconate dehydrogenase [Flavobacteriaceae bacterium D16]|nr:NADP-dependent phosphogluconate dehydrogenase [Flavobacteriaceae bacterium D16]